MLGITLQKTRVYREIKEEGRIEGLEQGLERGLEQGRLRGQYELILKLLTRRVGKVKKSTRSQLANLSIQQLESLGESLLEFKNIDDLTQWLEAQK